MCRFPPLETRPRRAISAIGCLQVASALTKIPDRLHPVVPPVVNGHAPGEVQLPLNQLVLTAAQTAVDPDEYDQKCAELEARYNRTSTKRADLDAQITDRQARLAQARAICDFLGSNPRLEYSDDTWALLVDHVDIYADGTISIAFKDQAIY